MNREGAKVAKASQQSHRRTVATTKAPRLEGIAHEDIAVETQRSPRSRSRASQSHRYSIHRNRWSRRSRRWSPTTATVESGCGSQNEFLEPHPYPPGRWAQGPAAPPGFRRSSIDYRPAFHPFGGFAAPTSRGRWCRDRSDRRRRDARATRGRMPSWSVLRASVPSWCVSAMGLLAMFYAMFFAIVAIFAVQLRCLRVRCLGDFAPSRFKIT